MCLPTENIKFCTCDNAEISTISNYWKLHHSRPKKGIHILGEVVMRFFKDENYKITAHALEKRLNELDAFDKKIEFENGELLTIHLKSPFPNSENQENFCFKFRNGIWKEEQYDYFDIANYYEEKTAGKIKS